MPPPCSAWQELGNIYTRIMNPTQAVFEERVAALEGGVAALAVASGQAAETVTLLNLAENGGHIVSSASLYGGTYNLFHYTLPKLGIEVTFVDDPDDLDAWRAAIRPNTKAFFAETLGNPKGDVLDFEGVSAVAHEHGIPLVVDNTARHALPGPAPAARRRHRGPLGHEVHRWPRHVHRRGHRRRRQLRLRGQRPFPGLHRTRPQLPRPGLRAAARGPVPGPFRRSRPGCSTCGTPARPSPLSTPSSSSRDSRPSACAWSATSQNATAVAEWLEARDEVAWVTYPGLESSPWHDRPAAVPAQGRRRHHRLRHRRRRRGRAESSSRAWSSSATWPTWATCAAWPSTRPRRPTRS